MFCLLNTVNKIKQLPVKILSNLSDKMISPLILYNCEIWRASLPEKKNYSEQNLVQNLFHFAVRSELGRFPLHIKIYTAMLKY